MHVVFTRKNLRKRKAIGRTDAVRTRDWNLQNDFTKSPTVCPLLHSSVENGRIAPAIETLEKMARGLEVSLCQLSTMTIKRPRLIPNWLRIAMGR
jgi:hypothetical protein